jgi:sporulation protein YlmC with PRC-barrel domain
MSTSSSTLARSLRDSVGPELRLLSASALSGHKVVNRNGETLGEIDDILLDVPRGRIAYAVMGVGGFLGVGERRVALPFTALTQDTDRQCFLIDASLAAFETAPGFDDSQWAATPELGWHEEVHRYYGARPYWN